MISAGHGLDLGRGPKLHFRVQDETRLCISSLWRSTLISAAFAARQRNRQISHVPRIPSLGETDGGRNKKGTLSDTIVIVMTSYNGHVVTCLRRCCVNLLDAVIANEIQRLDGWV